MKKRVLYLSLLVFGVGIGIGLISSWSGLAARFQAQPVLAREQAIANGVLKGDSMKSSTTTSTLAADQLVQELNIKAAQQVTQEISAKSTLGVWLHIRQEWVFDQDTPNNGVLPNGMVIPNQQIDDIWYQVNDQGLVVESVTIMRTMDGKIIQVGVASKGTGWNSATHETTPQEQFRLEQGLLDSNFLNNDLKWLEKFGNVAEIKDMGLTDNNSGVEIVIGAKNDTPVKTDSYNQPYTRGETRAIFDKATGFLISRGVTFWLMDGSQRKFSQLTQKITIEQPTNEVLGYLAQKDQDVTK